MSSPFVTGWTVAHQVPLSMGHSQARILEWVAISLFRGSCQPRDWTRVSCTRRRILHHWACREALLTQWFGRKNREQSASTISVQVLLRLQVRWLHFENHYFKEWPIEMGVSARVLRDSFTEELTLTWLWRIADCNMKNKRKEVLNRNNLDVEVIY